MHCRIIVLHPQPSSEVVLASRKFVMCTCVVYLVTWRSLHQVSVVTAKNTIMTFVIFVSWTLICWYHSIMVDTLAVIQKHVSSQSWCWSLHSPARTPNEIWLIVLSFEWSIMVSSLFVLPRLPDPIGLSSLCIKSVTFKDLPTEFDCVYNCLYHVDQTRATGRSVQGSVD